MNGITNSNRIVISRKRIEPSYQEGNSTQSKGLYPSLMKKAETQVSSINKEIDNYRMMC